MSFSSLPTELVSHIIESSVPSTFHSTTYKERQATLLSLRLVSRLFRQLAQPLLFQLVCVKSQMGFGLVIDSLRLQECSVSIQQLVLDRRNGGDEAVTIFDGIAGIAQESRLVGRVVLATHAYDISIPALATFTDLVDLHLSMESPSLANLDTLPTLRSLTLYNTGLSAIQALLKPRVVPNLEALALVDAHDEYANSLLETDIVELLSQLRVFSIDINIWQALDVTFRDRFSSKTLVDSSIQSIQSAFGDALRARNLRIYTTISIGWSADDVQHIVDAFARAVDIVGKSTSPFLANLYLDSGLHTLLDRLSLLEDVILKLVDTCEGRGIKIVWEESPSDFHVDPVISPIFWRRQRERKRLGGDQAK